MLKYSILFLALQAGTMAVVLLGGCAASISERKAPDSPVGRGEVWEEAERIAAMGEDRFVAWGTGVSMAPIYDSHVVLVISRVSFDQLRPGMHVAFTDSAGRTIVHELSARVGETWTAKGIGNDERDSELVTPQNLRGAVYAVFYPEDE